MIWASSVRPGDRNSNFPHHATTKTLEPPAVFFELASWHFSVDGDVVLKGGSEDVGLGFWSPRREHPESKTSKAPKTSPAWRIMGLSK